MRKLEFHSWKITRQLDMKEIIMKFLLGGCGLVEEALDIVGPSIISRVTTYSLFVVTQAFTGHLGNLELAAFSIGCNVILGFDLGLMVYFQFSYVFGFH